MTPVLQLFILGLAVYRVAHLIVEDLVLEPIRERTVFKLAHDNMVRELFECMWCVSLWLGGSATIAWWLDPTITTWVAIPFALSAFAGFLASREA